MEKKVVYHERIQKNYSPEKPFIDNAIDEMEKDYLDVNFCRNKLIKEISTKTNKSYYEIQKRAIRINNEKIASEKNLTKSFEYAEAIFIISNIRNFFEKKQREINKITLPYNIVSN
jgi:hypothetical protein